MKKKYFLIPFSVAALVVIAYFPVKNIVGKCDIMSEWGKILSDSSKENTDSANQQSANNYKLSTAGAISERIISYEDIFEVGNDILITNQEVEVAKAFYILQGYSDRDATQTAVKYIEDYNAMYVEAVYNGFDVSEKEVEKYISDLKNLTEQAGNSDEVKKVISQFDSEDEYWDYQKIISQKQLPIQNYEKSLEKEYLSNIGENSASDGKDATWNEELNRIKDDATKQQQFKKLDSINDIDKKFEV